MVPRSRIVSTLRRVPLFNELLEKELSSIAEHIEASSFDAGQFVFTEGDRGGDLLMVHEGSVRVVKMSPAGRHQLLAIERAGCSLGEVSVFDGGLYSTTAIAIEPTVILRLRGAHFQSLCIQRPEVAIKVIKVLGHRLRHLRRLVEDLSFNTVRGRLISHLLRLGEDGGLESEGEVEIALIENNEQLAARLGTVRELVSRNLGRLHGEGLIVMRRRAVVIRDQRRLRAELEQ